MNNPKKTKKYTPVKNFTHRQIDFAIRYYLPNSPTYGNALQSAISAGYSEKYAKNITVEAERSLKWFKEIVLELTGKPTDKKNLVEKAKKVIEKSLDSEDERIRADLAKFVAKTDPEFSEKQDVTSGGKTLAPVVTVKFAKPTKEWEKEHGERADS